MPLTLPNTTLNLSTVDQLKAVYEYVVAELSLVDPPNPFTNGLLRQSDQDIAKLIYEVISANLVSVGCSTLPSFSIPDYDNDTLVKVLIDQLNYSIAACNLGGDGGESTSLLLIPTGAIESADGEYQRFVYDGEHAYEVAPETLYLIWHAELPAQHRQSEYQIALKMPELTDDQAVNVFITEADISLAALLVRDFSYFALELRSNDGSTALLLNIADDQPNSSNVSFSQPAAGSVITLTLTTSSLDYAYDGGTGSIAIPAGFFANPPNIWAYSGAMDAADVKPLSIKVSVTS